MRVGLATAAILAFQQCEAAGITKPFPANTTILDSNGNSLGSVKGRTSWIRSNYGANADLTLTLEIITERTTEEDKLWTSPII